jgi:hypothetical protein
MNNTNNIFPGRFMAKTDESFVVFILGMRINNWFAVKSWMQAFQVMAPMLQTLSQNREKGFLGRRLFYYNRGVVMLQYWRSQEDLIAFAHNTDDPHLAAWRRFNQNAGKDGSVGVWHETYPISAGQYENIYVNMPRFCLAEAVEHVPAGKHKGSKNANELK